MFEEESPYVEIFNRYVPREYLRKVFNGLHGSYEAAYRTANKDFEEPEAKNYVPARRRALVEGMLRNRAAAFDSILATAEPDPHSGWWNHSRIVFDDHVILTQSKVPHSDYVVRHSFFREQYAQDNGQKLLFAFEDEPPVRRSEKLYGILLHGCAYKRPDRLGFAVIRFPLPDISGYYAGSVNLFREFAEDVRRLDIGPANESPVEDVDQEPDIGLNEEDDVG